MFKLKKLLGLIFKIGLILGLSISLVYAKIGRKKKQQIQQHESIHQTPVPGTLESEINQSGLLPSLATSGVGVFVGVFAPKILKDIDRMGPCYPRWAMQEITDWAGGLSSAMVCTDHLKTSFQDTDPSVLLKKEKFNLTESYMECLPRQSIDPINVECKQHTEGIDSLSTERLDMEDVTQKQEEGKNEFCKCATKSSIVLKRSKFTPDDKKTKLSQVEQKSLKLRSEIFSKGFSALRDKVLVSLHGFQLSGDSSKVGDIFLNQCIPAQWNPLQLLEQSPQCQKFFQKTSLPSHMKSASYFLEVIQATLREKNEIPGENLNQLKWSLEESFKAYFDKMTKPQSDWDKLCISPPSFLRSSYNQPFVDLLTSPKKLEAMFSMLSRFHELKSKTVQIKELKLRCEAGEHPIDALVAMSKSGLGLFTDETIEVLKAQNDSIPMQELFSSLEDFDKFYIAWEPLIEEYKRSLILEDPSIVKKLVESGYSSLSPEELQVLSTTIMGPIKSTLSDSDFQKKVEEEVKAQCNEFFTTGLVDLMCPQDLSRSELEVQKDIVDLYDMAQTEQNVTSLGNFQDLSQMYCSMETDGEYELPTFTEIIERDHALELSYEKMDEKLLRESKENNSFPLMVPTTDVKLDSICHINKIAGNDRDDRTYLHGLTHPYSQELMGKCQSGTGSLSYIEQGYCARMPFLDWMPLEGISPFDTLAFDDFLGASKVIKVSVAGALGGAGIASALESEDFSQNHLNDVYHQEYGISYSPSGFSGDAFSDDGFSNWTMDNKVTNGISSSNNYPPDYGWGGERPLDAQSSQELSSIGEQDHSTVAGGEEISSPSKNNTSSSMAPISPWKDLADFGKLPDQFGGPNFASNIPQKPEVNEADRIEETTTKGGDGPRSEGGLASQDSDIDKLKDQVEKIQDEVAKAIDRDVDPSPSDLDSSASKVSEKSDANPASETEATIASATHSLGAGPSVAAIGPVESIQAPLEDGVSSTRISGNTSGRAPAFSEIEDLGGWAEDERSAMGRLRREQLNIVEIGEEDYGVILQGGPAAQALIEQTLGGGEGLSSEEVYYLELKESGKYLRVEVIKDSQGKSRFKWVEVEASEVEKLAIPKIKDSGDPRAPSSGPEVNPEPNVEKCGFLCQAKKLFKFN